MKALIQAFVVFGIGCATVATVGCSLGPRFTKEKELTGHTGNIFAVDLSHDGKTLVSCGDDNTIRIWNLATGRERRKITREGVSGVAIAPGGTTIASSGLGGTIELWDAGRGALKKTLHADADFVAKPAFSNDGSTLVSGGDDGTARLWDVDTGRERARLRTAKQRSGGVALSPDGSIIAAASYEWPKGSPPAAILELWDARTLRPRRALWKQNPGIIWSVAFSADGKKLAAGADDGGPYGRERAGGGVIRVWDLVTERESPTLRGHLDGVNSLTFCPDGRTLISGSADHTIKLWRVDRGELLKTLTEHKGSVHAVVLTSDGETLISAGAGLPGEHFDPNPGQIIVWRKQKEP